MSKVIKIEDNKSYFSVLVKKGKMSLWLDLYKDLDNPDTEWNQYIFNTDDSNDMKVKKFQENSNNFLEFASTAENFIEELINSGYGNLIDLESYNKVLKSGMFFEFHPELSGEYKRDIKTIISNCN